jgi:hypothetical protein
MLGSFAEPRALPIARKIVADEDATQWVHRQASFILGTLKDSASFGYIEAAFRSGDQGLMRSGIAALGASRGKRSLELLRDGLRDPAYGDFEHSLVRAVGVPGHEEVIVSATGDLEVELGRQRRGSTDVDQAAEIEVLLEEVKRLKREAPPPR